MGGKHFLLTAFHLVLVWLRAARKNAKESLVKLM